MYLSAYCYYGEASPLFYFFLFSFSVDMTSAEFISNPDPHTTVYQWEAVGVDKLNRTNKLTSLPFWVPNSTSRHHQFRIVLLRGLVPTNDPSRDAVGAILEHIPPPSEGSAGASSPLDSFPGGCAIKLELLPIQVKKDSDSSKVINATRTAVIDAQNAQVVFSELISPDAIDDPDFATGNPKTLTLQVTIETHISIPLHNVTNAASSFFSTFTTSISSLMTNTASLVGHRQESITAALLSSTAPAEAEPVVAGSALPPWDSVPEAWRHDPTGWSELVSHSIVGIDGVFREGPEKRISSDESELLAASGLSEGDLWPLYSLFSFERDVHERLLTSQSLRERRYYFVPSKLKEVTFWAHYFWKVRCLARCTTREQVCAVLAALCTPSRSGAIDLSGSMEVVCNHVLDAEEVVSVMRYFIDTGETAHLCCFVVMETARNSVAVMDTCLQRTDIPLPILKHVERVRAALDAVLKECRMDSKSDHAVQEVIVTEASTAPPLSPQSATDDVPVPTACALTDAEVVPPSPAKEPESVSKPIEFPKMPWEEEEDNL